MTVDHYLEYGQNYSRKVRMLGYLNRKSLRQRGEGFFGCLKNELFYGVF